MGNLVILEIVKEKWNLNTWLDPLTHLLAGRGCPQVLRILALLGGVVSRTQKLPSDASEMVWDALPYQLLQRGRHVLQGDKASTNTNNSGGNNINITNYLMTPVMTSPASVKKSHHKERNKSLMRREKKNNTELGAKINKSNLELSTLPLVPCFPIVDKAAPQPPKVFLGVLQLGATCWTCPRGPARAPRSHRDLKE